MPGRRRHPNRQPHDNRIRIAKAHRRRTRVSANDDVTAAADLGRKVLYRFGVPVAMLIPRLLLSSYRIVRLIGEDIIPSLLAENKIFLPTYWHQHHLLCVKYLGRFYSDGLKLGFLISPSVGGELGANVVTRSVRT